MRKRFRKWVPVFDVMAVIFLLVLGGGNFLIGIFEGSFNHHYAQASYQLLLGGFLLLQAHFSLDALKRAEKRDA